jgi:branched-chain amino acid transport system substrate-binding protein
MKGKKILTVGGVLFLVLALVTLSFMGACAKQSPTPAPTPSPAPESIKIGALVCITGGDASNGLQQKRGYELAVEDINKAGGIYVKEFDKKIPIELKILDMETNPDKARVRAEALYSEYHVVASVGALLIGAAADIFEKNKMPMVGIANSVQSVHECGYKYYFSACAKAPDMAKANFDFLDTLPIKPTKLAIFVEESDWVIECVNFINQEAAARGYEVVVSEKYAMLAKDLSPLVLKAKDAGAEVLLAYPVTPDGLLMVRQMKELDYNPKLVMFTRAAADSAWGNLGSIADYVVGQDQWHPAVNFPGVKELCAEWEAKFKQAAQPMTGPAYANIQIMADAIERAGTLDPDKIRDAIAATDMMTVVGQIKFRENGTLIDPLDIEAQWQNKVRELVWPESMKTKPLIYPAPMWSER